MFFNKKVMQQNNKTAKVEILEQEKKPISGTLTDFAKDTVKQTVNSFGSLGGGIFEQLLNGGHVEKNEQPQSPANQKEENLSKASSPSEANIFNFGEIEDRRQIQEIQQLIEAIKQEVKGIKQAGSSLMSEVSDIEKLTINNLPEKPGIYHVRFLEIILKILHSLKMKINESGTWMEALRSKKAKRGSAFMARSKKQGTQYSMSQELTLTRSVQ